MTIHDRDDAILVKVFYTPILQEDKDPKLLTAYYTTAISETILMFQNALKYNIEIVMNEFGEIPKEFYNDGSYVTSLRIVLGDIKESAIPTIEVYLDEEH